MKEPRAKYQDIKRIMGAAIIQTKAFFDFFRSNAPEPQIFITVPTKPSGINVATKKKISPMRKIISPKEVS